MPQRPPHDEEDFFAWTQAQAACLRDEQGAALDSSTLAEEIERVGKSPWHALENRLAVLVRQLLKWGYQPEKRHRGRSWRSTIWEQRSRIRRLVCQSPSLRPHVLGMLVEEYASMRQRTVDETGLSPAVLPAQCPWTVDDILDEAFWPEASRPQETAYG